MTFSAFGIFYGLGTIIVSFYPCDAGCNKEFINPSISQIIHNLMGALTYLVVPVALLLIGFIATRWKQYKNFTISSIICGVIALLFSFLLSADLKGDFIGLFHRIIEGSILIWIVITALRMKTPAPINL